MKINSTQKSQKIKCVKNSKEVRAGDIFISIKGAKFNGNDFIIEAVCNGASKIIVQTDNPVSEEIISFLVSKKIILEYVTDTYLTFAQNIKAQYENKFDHLTFIGVTGTKGKTTTCNALFNFLRLNGHSTALMSTVFHKINDITEKANLTTEMINAVYDFLEKAYNHNVTHVVFEVSAQAFSQYRIFGIKFDAFIFTNFSPEHSEYYKTIEDYFLSKCQLYNYLKPNAVVLLNKEDQKTLSSINYSNNKKYIIKTFSSKLEDEADIYYNIKSDSVYITKAIFHYKFNTYLFNSSWLGIYNIANIACALIILDELMHLNEQKILFLLKQTEQFQNIPGRNERYFISNNRTVCIEKAYTPHSVFLTLKSLRTLTNNLIVLFGCGGEKDTGNRPIMAKTVEQFADKIYVSSDNPRNEPLFNIFQDICKGFSFTKDTHIIKDRKEAIEDAIENAAPESIIVLLGKGDEQYQEIKNTFHYFSEKEIINKYVL